MYDYWRRLVGLILIVFFVCSMKAQKRTPDAMGWLSLAMEQKIYNRFSYQAMARVRDGDNLRTITSYYVDLGLYYKITKKCKISLHYVYAPSRTSDDRFRRLHQYYVSINQKFPVNAYWYISNRMIGQHTSSYFLFDNGYKPYSRTDAREKIAINRRISKNIIGYLGNEWMIVLNHHPVELRRNRVYMGINYKITRQFSTDCFFVLQSSFHKPKGDQNDYVLGVTFLYKFKKMIDDD